MADFAAKCLQKFRQLIVSQADAGCKHTYGWMQRNELVVTAAEGNDLILCPHLKVDKSGRTLEHTQINVGLPRGHLLR